MTNTFELELLWSLSEEQSHEERIYTQSTTMMNGPQSCLHSPRRLCILKIMLQFYYLCYVCTFSEFCSNFELQWAYSNDLENFYLIADSLLQFFRYLSTHYPIAPPLLPSSFRFHLSKHLQNLSYNIIIKILKSIINFPQKIGFKYSHYLYPIFLNNESKPLYFFVNSCKDASISIS